MNILIVIAAYNEEATIRNVIMDFFKCIPQANFCIVDNNSTDKTNEIAQKTLYELNATGCVLFEKQQGKAHAVRKAFMETEADIYVLVDADCTYSASDAGKLIELVINGRADFVVGDRHSSGDYSSENKRPFHNFGNILVMRLINFLFKSDLKDILSGYRVFSRQFVKNYPILSEGFEIETEMTLHALDKKFTIREVPIQYKDRPKGSVSKLNTFSDGFRVLKTILTIFKDYRPMSFFGTLSFLFFLSGVCAGIPVLMDYYFYRYIYHIPLTILATGLMLTSMLCLTIGLILDTVVKYQRFNYMLNLSHFNLNTKSCISSPFSTQRHDE